MALNFPTNPYVGQQYPAPNGIIYTWDGTKWNATPSPVTGNITFSNNTIGTNNLGNVYIDANNNLWEFNTQGNLVLPDGGGINYHCGSNALLGGTTAVTWGTLGNKNNSCGPTQIALGKYAGITNQCTCTVAIGTNAGSVCQNEYSVAIGICAGAINQGAFSTAVGPFAGINYQGSCAVAVGCSAAYGFVDTRILVDVCGSNITVDNSDQIVAGMMVIGNGIASGTSVTTLYTCNVIRLSSHPTSALIGETITFTGGQGYAGVAVGYAAGAVLQGACSVAVGHDAGNFNQGDRSVAIGAYAGIACQGHNAVAIGYSAGAYGQPNNSIMINASCADLTGTESGFYVDPVRNCTGNVANAVYFNTVTKELTYGPIAASTTSELVNGPYTFALTSSGQITMPCNTQLNSGGICARNAASLLFTTCREFGPTGPIIASSINMSAGNGGIGIQVVGPYAGGACGSGGPSIVNVGTENISGANGPGFAGMIASDPNVTSPYSVVVAGNNIIEIGFLQPCYVSTTNGYTVGVGVLNHTKSVNGLFVNEIQTVLNGGNATPAIVQMSDVGIHLNTNSANTQLPTNQLWWNVYGDLTANKNENSGSGVVQDAGGNVYVVGITIDTSQSAFYMSELLKYDSQGAMIYHKRWLDANNLPPCVYNQTIDIDANGKIWFLANNFAIDGFYVGSFNPSDGAIEQQYSYGIENIISKDMAVDDYGNQYVTGQYINNSNYYQVITKVNAANGAMQWNTVSNLVSTGYAVDTDIDGNVYVGGQYYDGTNYNPIIWKFDNNGALIWAKLLFTGYTNQPSSPVVQHLAIHNSNLYAVVDDSSASTTIVMCLTIDGATVVWNQIIGLFESTYGYDLSFDTYGYVYVTGTTGDVPAGANFYVAKLNALNGTPIWENTFGTYFAEGEGEPSPIYGSRIANVNNGLLVLTGYTTTDPQTGEYNTLPKFITVQLPTDNSLPYGQYGVFTLANASYISENSGEFLPVDVTSAFSFASQTLYDAPSTLNPVPFDVAEGYTNFNYNMVPPQPTVTITTGNAIAGGGTWTFDGRGSLTFPDGSRQISAYEVVNIDMDGGGASTVYEVSTLYAEGGTAANKFGPNDTSFNGGNAAVIYGAGSTTLNGGAA